MRFRCANWLPAILSIVVGWGAPAASSAQSAAGLVNRLRDSAAVGADSAVNVYTLPDETIVVIDTPNIDEQWLHRVAAAIAEAAGEDPAARTRALKIICCDPSHKTKSLSVTADQLSSAAGRESIQRLPLLSGEQAAGAKAPARPGISSAAYQTQRKRLVARIKGLETKGVGVKPLFDELSRIDGLYSHGDSLAVRSAFERLDSTVAEHEQLIQKKSLTSSPASSANLAPPMSSAKQAAMQQMLAQMRAQGATQKQINDALADFQGTSDAYYDEIARTMLQHELGDLAPAEGPFRMERFRIAKKIQELRNKGADTAGYVSYYRKLEEEAAQAQKDPRRLAEMADNIRYMNKQLGLSELQGGSHRHQ